MASYGSQEEGFLHGRARCRGGNSYRQIGSFAVKRTKQMGFRLGEIFSRKCVLNLAQVLTYAVSVLPASVSPTSQRTIISKEGESSVILSCDEKEYKTALSSASPDLNANRPLRAFPEAPEVL